MAKKYNCVKNGIQYFRKTKTIGHKMDGTPVKKEFYGDGEKDCDKQIEEYMNRIKNGLRVDKEYLTVEQLMNDWIFNVLLPSQNVKSGSLEKHEGNYRLYVKNSKIAVLRITEVKSKHIQEYYNQLYKDGISSRKIFDLNKSLRKFFNYCITESYIKDNPCSLKRIEIPGDADAIEYDEENEILPFNDNELQIIRSNIPFVNGKNNTFNVAVGLDLVTGLRRGEVFALTKGDINFEKCTVRVTKTLSLVKVFKQDGTHHRELKLISPKTKSSIRTVPFPKSFKKILEDYFLEQEIKYQNNNLTFQKDSLLFTTSSCRKINPQNFARAWDRFLKRININHRTYHSIRDTYATTLVRRGAKILDVKDLLGHSTINTTEKYYLFVFPEDKTSTVSLIEDFVPIKN